MSLRADLGISPHQWPICVSNCSTATQPRDVEQKCFLHLWLICPAAPLWLAAWWLGARHCWGNLRLGDWRSRGRGGRTDVVAILLPVGISEQVTGSLSYLFGLYHP